MRRLINLVGVLLWFAGLGLGLFGLAQLGSVLPIPQTAQISAWLIDTPAAEIALTLLRALCMLGIVYLLAASVIASILELGRVQTRFVSLNSIPVRRMLRSAIGASVVATTMASVSPAGAVEVHDYPILHHVDPNARPTTTTTTTTTTTVPAVEATPAAPAPALSTQNELATHTVISGDSLWSIATQYLEAAGREATPREIADLVQRLGDDNAEVFADKGNRDLIFPGQVFRLPSF